VRKDAVFLLKVLKITMVALSHILFTTTLQILVVVFPFMDEERKTLQLK
jgi:hypothetical protein